MTPVDDVVALLASAIGLNPDSIGVPSIERAMRRRMASCSARDEADYAARARASQLELLALVEEIVVPETWFFRDEQPFRYLARTVVPRFRLAHPRGIFRVLSVPCSTGEEPYSIVMTLLDAGLLPSQFHVDAIDISERAITQARRARFGSNSFRGAMALEAQGRHFKRAGDAFRLDPAIAGAVTFLRGNLLDATFAPTQLQYDAVFCRNLLIYLDREARKTALRKLERFLAPDAPIFAGHAESLQLIDPKLKPEGSGAFAFLREAKRRTSTRPPPVKPRTRRSVPRMGAVRVPSFSEPSPFATGPHPKVQLPSGPPPAPPPLARAVELANAGKLEEAHRICEERLRLGPDAAVYCLLGVIHHAKADFRRAEELFTRAVYLDKHHHEALLYLALLCDKRDDPTSAAQFRRRAERARAAGGGKGTG